MIALLASLALANPSLNDPSRDYALELDAELGFVAPLYNHVQFSQNGTNINYVSEGGQDNLFPVARTSVKLIRGKQRYTLLWQPLNLEATATPERDWQVDEVLFPAGRPVHTRYGFPYWRFSWGHAVFEDDHRELTLGLGFQIRNATIGFTAVDGSASVVNRDIGPVPLLEAEYRVQRESGSFIEVEIDGFYAPIKYLNGRDVDVIGAIVDAELRYGLKLAEPTSAWVGLRYLAGGGEGTGTPDGGGDGFTSNWLHFAALTVGARIR